VIEGFVNTDCGEIGFDPRHRSAPGRCSKGPSGTTPGFYSLPDRYPILEVTAITHRRDPIYPTTIVGLPPQEDYFHGQGDGAALPAAAPDDHP
jgi:3-polyprenyl-4-hydroxybenzoate decarboxylase